MRRPPRILLNAATIVSLSLAFAAAPGPTTRPSPSLEGTWESRGMVDILGARTDRILRVAASTRPSARQITFSQVRHPTDTQRAQGHRAQTSTFGTFEAEIAGDMLLIRHPAGVARYSFAVKDDLLTLGALRRTRTAVELVRTYLVDVDFPRWQVVGNPPPLQVFSYRWTFADPPESAPRGTGVFSVKAEPDPLNSSAQFAFDWEWLQRHDGPKLQMWRRNAADKRIEHGTFAYTKTGDLYYYANGDPDAPFYTSVSYRRVPATQPTPATAPAPLR
jgi:hypothetical protein